MSVETDARVQVEGGDWPEVNSIWRSGDRVLRVEEVEPADTLGRHVRGTVWNPPEQSTVRPYATDQVTFWAVWTKIGEAP